MSASWNRRDILLLIALLCLVLSAVLVRLPGVHWLAGYGYEDDYSFHPDDFRFIISAKDFRNQAAKPSGYPLFMSTQLYVIDKFLHDVAHADFNAVVVLRCISIVYAISSLILFCFFLRALGFSRRISFLATFFLAFSPLHIILSHFGTADMSAFFLFYLTMFAAWRYRAYHKELWFYAAAALAGVTMADKFYLPSLIPVAVIVLCQPMKKMWGNIFVSMCVFTTFFCAASFFNFTPWDLNQLRHMLISDNLVVEGGKSPLEQVVLYPWDIVACSGVVTFVLAVIGCVILFRHFDISRLKKIIGKWEKKGIDLSRITEKTKTRLRAPSTVIILPLLFHAALIVMAQVHGCRHILVFIPVICTLAAIAVTGLVDRFRLAARPIQALGALAIFCMLGFQFADGMVTDRVYPADIRARLGDFLTARQPTEVSSFSGYTHLKGVSIIDHLPDTPIFVSCDLEYRRYILASQGKSAFHVFGGKPRTDFFVSLLAGQTDYTSIFNVKRKRLSLEDHLAKAGWLPAIDTFVPNECSAFQKRAIQS